ncbi:MAG TPA: class I SAM-dependent methyltransferase [Galbitalea sp.]|jgi:16S rRNA (guanine1207-N2)-methyltransferase|nr:class I SAM-dependent methyltransferase [Galbitalea sp.]
MSTTTVPTTTVPMTTLPALTSAADRLLMDEARPMLHGTIAVIDAGEIAMRVGNEVGRPRISLDSAADSARFNPGRVDVGLEDVVRDADVVLLRLPKSLDQLDDIAREVARHAKATVTLIAGGRLKYMSLSMNDVLARSFGNVRASLARQKSRVLFAAEPRAVAAPEPRNAHLDDLDLDVVAWGGVFAGASLDIGTRAMLATFDSLPAFERAIDFGCGTGILAAQLKRARPAARVIASDDSEIAVRSARETFAANALDIAVAHESLLDGQAGDSVDLIVLNPPFHEGGSVSRETAQAMFVAAARKLRPGGELRVVWNSHLGYRPALESTVGPTTQLTRTPKFTVTTSIKPTN